MTDVSVVTDFRTQMRALQAHHEAALATPFAWKSTVTGPRAAFDAGPANSALDAIRAQLREQVQASTDEQKTGIGDTTTELQADKDADSFRKKMTAQRDQAKIDNAKVIDDAYSKAIDLGEKHPQMQDNIANTMDQVSKTLTTILGAITTLISNLMGAIMDIIQGILKPLEEIAQTFGPIAGVIALL